MKLLINMIYKTNIYIVKRLVFSVGVFDRRIIRFLINKLLDLWCYDEVNVKSKISLLYNIR